MKIWYLWTMAEALLLVAAALPVFAQEEVKDPPVPTPMKLWEEFRETLEPFSFTIEKDEVVPSETRPDQKLRQVTFSFSSQDVPCAKEGGSGKEWRMEKLWHCGKIFIPADPRVLDAPERRGKVVVVGSLVGHYLDSFYSCYGEAIAARTGYPTMILPNPGETRDRPGQMYDQRWLMDHRKEHYRITSHSHFRWAVPYLRALDVMAEVLDVERDQIRAVIGGHSKRATGAFTAAAMEPERIAGVVFMGNESLHPEGPESKWWAVSPYYTQRFIRCPVIYLGATNEGGYSMFDINKIQEKMISPWILEIIPNYRHASESEVQFLNWQMWVSHVFDARPLARISGLSHEEIEKGTRFQACIDAPNKVILARIWYVYCDDVPYWRDLTWYPTLLYRKGDNLYEGYVHGKTPDAWMVEVHDTAKGFRGYVSSLPQDITHKPVQRRQGRGMPRAWEEKQP